MSVKILLNILIAISWTILGNNYTIIDFVIGYIFGFFILMLAKPFLPDAYIRRFRLVALLKLIILFAKELTLANIAMMKIVLNPKYDIQPGIVAVPTKLEKDWQVTLLAALITLTPGTLSMDFSEDSKYIYIHAVDVDDREEIIRGIHDTFERAILEVSN